MPGFGSVSVPLQIQVTATPFGADLVAVVPQQRTESYYINRITIYGGPQTDTATQKYLKFYKGAIGSNLFTTTQLTSTNDAQFIPPEYMPPGMDLFCVWEGQSASALRPIVIVTTDGGQVRP